MIDLGLTANDLTVLSGDLVLITDEDQIRQAVIQSLQTFYGEWFLDNTQGVPYFQTIFVKNPRLDLVQLSLQDAILNTPGIVSLNSFEFGYDNSLRSLTIQFQATCTNGQTINVTTQVGI